MTDISQFGKPLRVSLEHLKADRVLYEFEIPRIFSFLSEYGDFLCYVARANSDEQLVILTPSTAKAFSELESGRVTVRESLEQSWSWLVKADYAGAVQEVISLDNGIPEAFLPKPGLMLSFSLQPLLSVKLEGKAINEHTVRASVARQAIDAGTLVLKRIVDFIWNANPEGRPREVLRFLSDLPTQRFAFGSFQVDFGRPDSNQFNLDRENLANDLTQIGIELNRLVNWATNNEAADPQQGEGPVAQDLDIQELKALERLVPPMTGQVETVMISGTLLGTEAPKILTRNSTQKLKRALRLREREQVLRSYTGRIGQVDKDASTFTLRDVRDAERAEVLCSFQADLFEIVLDHLGDDRLVTVFGRQVKGIFEIGDLSSIQDPEQVSVPN